MAVEFSSFIDQALAERKIAGGSAIAIDSDGKTLISKQFGKISLDDNASAFTPDTTAWIASSTKLLTSICALQCVEKGLFGLDDDITTFLPEWKNPEILTGFDDSDKPILVPAKNKITLRLLLTHSAGMGYYGFNPKITKYRDMLKLEPVSTGTINSRKNPLVYEPGTGWQYSTSIDWAGHMVERATGLKLGVYMQQHIFSPLNMTSTTFDPVGNDNIMSRMTGRVGRDPKTGKLIKEVSDEHIVKNAPDHIGGGGLYSTAGDYIKVLRSLLLDDGVLLPANSNIYSFLFTPQFKPGSQPARWFHRMATDPVFGAFLAPAFASRDPNTTKWNHALGGGIVEAEIPGLAKQGTLFWSGLPNNFWWIDREGGTAGFYESWLLPPGDVITGSMYQGLMRGAMKEREKAARRATTRL